MNNIQEEKPSKKERYLLKREQKEKEHLRRSRNKKIKKIIMISLPLILIVGGGVFGLLNYSPKGDQNPQREGQGTPRIEINPLEYDAGNVSMADGLVKKTYEIKNSGDGDLKIDKIWTSCDCTTAILRVGDKQSPKFGMHTSSTLWSQKIAPGEIGFLEVIFDPAFHGPQGVGQNLREVYLSTNDPQNQKVKVRLIANVIQ